jgi:coenzyme PQQ synthesis protein D (PqqD)
VPERYVARNPQTAWRVYDGEAVILLGEDSTLNTLNPVGTLIWEVADGKTPVSAIVARICDEFDVEAAEARRDAAAFIETLCKRGLLTMSESPRGEP